MPVAILRAVIAEGERQPELAHEFLQEGPYAMHAMIRRELDRSVARGEMVIADTDAAARLMADMAYGNIFEYLVKASDTCHSDEATARRLDLAIRVFLRGIS